MTRLRLALSVLLGRLTPDCPGCASLRSERLSWASERERFRRTIAGLHKRLEERR